jgi:hypothetical protein
VALPTQPWEPDDDAPVARVVRPYTLTGGRTAPRVSLPVEATLRRQGSGPKGPVDGNLARILEVCDKRSVAEVSALVSMPIGVVRVLLGDLIEEGHVLAQATLTADSSKDERRELIERTLRGLRTL